MIATSCTTRNHCGRAAECDRCAKERQRILANHAEILEKKFGQLTMTVLVPEENTQAAIHRLRASLIRRQLAKAGIWTVETGSIFAGLHLNILSPAPIAATWRKATSYTELVRCTSREAAAYISKRSGMPPKTQYSGNLYGTFGQLFTYLSSPDALPVVQAAALEISISGKKELISEKKISSNEQDWATNRPDLPQFYNQNFPELCNPPLIRRESTLEERRLIMQKHLPNIMAIMNNTNKTENLKTK